MFSRIGKAALKPDLTNTLRLCAALGDPQHSFKSVHIAGTNGKGSTSHMLAAVFSAAGYTTGLYTSPHLVDFRERIRINGAMVSEEWVVNFVEKIKPYIEEINPSFFEITVVMAFQAFKEAGLDIAIVETGLGGRLDSTNVITPLLSVITNISYDHKDLLGDTLAAIASEKAGIIKPGVPVVIGEQHPETERVFFTRAVGCKSPLFYADSLYELVKIDEQNGRQHFKVVNSAHSEVNDIYCDLMGSYQQHNIKTVLAAIGLLRGMGYTLTDDAMARGLYDVKGLTGLRGRWEILRQQPLVVADVGHNTAGVALVLAQWAQVPAARKHVVLGFVSDKEVTEVLQMFPKEGVDYYFTNAAIPRAMPAQDLAERAAACGLPGGVYPTVAQAMEASLAAAAPNHAILVTGSFFIVGEAMEYLAHA
ncbi:MAG: bifunctional folylpolyglutamate synthase/dihydrofolate synthase [Chitinophagia bacterium]|nr:bifunctional folylpolyglutamate synthase/dihydrofolate synthase [Chitinophagia bacterium]